MTILAIAVLVYDVIWPQERRVQLGYLAGFGLMAI